MTGRPKGSTNIGVTMPMISRMQILRDAGLSSRAVAVVMNIDCGSDRFNETVVRYYTPRPGQRRFSKDGLASMSVDRRRNLPKVTA